MDTSNFFYLSHIANQSTKRAIGLFDSDFLSILLIILSSTGIYLAVIIYTRIFGKRSFSKMSSFDFAMTVAVGSIIATTILSETVNLLEGAVGLLMVYILQLVAAYLRRYNWFEKQIDNQPTLIMDGQTILYKNLKAVRLTEGDLRSKIREANVTKLSDIKAVIFETTGNLVVLYKEDNDSIDDWIMKDVKR
ncbi:DUF421 domain-containing protein [Winogradskyella wichelsiae]|uniref:DUF421 domain-containing protein n=1 Tax=Winogradskyella wichelsiae TaxID=2697007 RepID=UPI003EF62068